MTKHDLQSELLSIRALMERSAKFISLSGLSGILAGIYALIGAAIGYKLVYGSKSRFGYRDYYVTDEQVLIKLVIVAVLVLLAALATGVFLSMRKARKQKQQIWNPASRGLLKAAGIPLVTGGLFILILLARGLHGVIAPACLIFYGLALVAASQYTYKAVKWLGALQLLLGLLAASFPGYGLLFWTIGFGVLHIIYGTIMHLQYDRGND